MEVDLNFMYRPHYPRKELQYSLTRRLGGLQRGYGLLENTRFSCVISGYRR